MKLQQNNIIASKKKRVLEKCIDFPECRTDNFIFSILNTRSLSKYASDTSNALYITETQITVSTSEERLNAASNELSLFHLFFHAQTNHFQSFPVCFELYVFFKPKKILHKRYFSKSWSQCSPPKCCSCCCLILKIILDHGIGKYFAVCFIFQKHARYYTWWF